MKSGKKKGAGAGEVQNPGQIQEEKDDRRRTKGLHLIHLTEDCAVGTRN